MFGQSWAQEPAQRPRLEKRYMNQRKLTREIDPEAPINSNLKSGHESKSVYWRLGAPRFKNHTFSEKCGPLRREAHVGGCLGKPHKQAQEPERDTFGNALERRLPAANNRPIWSKAHLIIDD